MLRAIGAQIEKTTNREACRDLSGRRMRDVNNEKKLVTIINIVFDQSLLLCPLNMFRIHLLFGIFYFLLNLYRFFPWYMYQCKGLKLGK